MELPIKRNRMELNEMNRVDIFSNTLAVKVITNHQWLIKGKVIK